MNMDYEKKIIYPPTINQSVNGFYIYRVYKKPDREGRTFDEYMDANGRWYDSMAVKGIGAGGAYFFDRESAELALKKAEEKNMKKLNGEIEAGKYYKNRRGEKVGPMHIGYSRAWVDGNASAQDPEWNFDGTHHVYIHEMSDEDDLIEEWKDAPKTWDEMSPEEKGALLLATYEGKKIEFYVGGDRWLTRNNERPWDGTLCYRVAPEHRTIEVIGPDGYRITYKEFDGVPDCSTIKMKRV